MTDALTVGVLGVGNIGTVHLQSAQALDGVTVTAAADAVPAHRERARRFGVDAVYDDYRALLDAEDVDVAVVALPPFLHAEATVAAVRAGCDVFVEKPFARDPAEAREMIDAAAAAGATLGVDHTMRYQPAVQRVKAEYDAGRVGHVPLAVLTRLNDGPFEPPPGSSTVPEWQLDPEATGGGALTDLGVHLIDVLRWLFGELELRHAEFDSQLDLPFEDTACLVLKSRETGTIAVVNCGFFQWEEPPDVNSRVRLEGVTETLDTADYRPDRMLAHAATAAAGNVCRRALGRSPTYFGPTYYYRAHFAALRAYLAAVRDGRQPPVSGRDGLRTVELVAEAYGAADDAAVRPVLGGGRP